MAMFEAGDDAEDFLRYGWEHLKEVNAFAKQIKEGKKFNFEGVNTDGNDVSMLMRLVGGGDMSMINSMVGLAGCNCACPCPYCTRPKEKMCDTEECITDEERTLDMQRVLAHTVAGVTCPGCKMKIVEKTDFTPGFHPPQDTDGGGEARREGPGQGEVAQG
jgi:hypothetical protein